MDRTKINDVALNLNKAFNTGEKSYLQKARSLLDQLIPDQVIPEVYRGDQITIPQTTNFLKSGVPWFDNLLSGGLRKQELFLLAGVPYSGKTHILTYLAGGYLKQDFSVLHFNGEDILGDIYKLYEMVLDKEEQLQKLYLRDVTDYHFSIQFIENSVLKMQEKYNKKPDIILIDHLDIMSVDRQVQDWLGVTELTRQLRFIGKKHDAMIMTCTQMNYSTQDNQSALSRLFRGKVGKVMNADVVLSLETDPTMANKIYVQVEKARGRKITNSLLTLTTDYDIMIIQ